MSSDRSPSNAHNFTRFKQVLPVRFWINDPDPTYKPICDLLTSYVDTWSNSHDFHPTNTQRALLPPSPTASQRRHSPATAQGSLERSNPALSRPKTDLSVATLCTEQGDNYKEILTGDGAPESVAHRGMETPQLRRTIRCALVMPRAQLTTE